MYLEKNLSALKRYHPQAYAVTEGVSPTEGALSSRDGCFDLNTGGVWRHGGEFATEWNVVLDPLNSSYPKMLAFYGVGLGNHIFKAFEHENIRLTDHILLIERSPQDFKRALELRDWTPILGDHRVQIMLGMTVEESYPFFLRYFQNYSRIFLIKTLAVLIEPDLTAEGGKYYLAMAEQIKRTVLDANEMYMGSDEDCYRGFLNLIRNLPEFERAHPFDKYMGSFKGKIGIAVSTGPSLKHSLDWIRQVQDRAVIACSDSALKVLLNAGIEPHFVGCLERVPETKLLFDNLPDKLRTGLICCPVVWPETIEKYQGPLINMIRPIGQLCWMFDDQKPIFAGNSVSHLLYVALAEMGCDEILVVGQDLAFDRFSAKTHVDGVADLIKEVGEKQRFKKNVDLKFMSPMERTLDVTGNDGNPIQTMEWYVQFKYHLESLVAEYKKGVNVIPREYGARIEGLPLCEPSQVLDRYDFGTSLTWDTVAALEAKSPRQANYKNVIDAKLDYAEEKLLFIHKTALSVLDALSLFRQKHNPNYFGEETYVGFLRRVECIANNMVEDDKEFYDYFFYAQLLARSSWLQQFQGQVLANKIPAPQRIDAKFTLSTEWFDLIQKWSCRMAHFIRSVKADLWNLKSTGQNQENRV